MSFVYRAIQVPFNTLYEAVYSFVYNPNASTTNQLNLNLDTDSTHVNINVKKSEHLQVNKQYSLRPRKPVNYSV